MTWSPVADLASTADLAPTADLTPATDLALGDGAEPAAQRSSHVVRTVSAVEETAIVPVVTATGPTPWELADTGEVATTPAPGPLAHRGSPRRAGRTTRVAARLGVLGVLAGITVAIPVSQGLVPTPVAYGSDALADSTLPSTVTALSGSELSDLPPASLVSAAGGLAARVDTTGASRNDTRSSLAGCDGSVRDAGVNGQLKAVDLCTLWDNHTQLRADAAVSLAEFNEAFAARFGADLCLSSGYRTLAEQRAVKAEKGGLAAAPGKSNHGWGLAVDLCQDQTSGVKWAWLNENGPAYGWANPAWAQPGGSGPYERWHWEYTKAVKADGEYYDG
ncbi:M15 family metallopeptidase [Cellulomonas sp. McL0617]|uniref:M15 family metallopeptidase n=1 Tax=Cellulomonas sp. McL0617 TaxID=3415675 RepID=UPI003CF51286